ncbi:MAG: hypothetical protein LBT85_02100, partial [Bifidobacteriaceae bacterium]|nr:hypothetical protein [Bifidobacteriaceae bacterium]
KINLSSDLLVLLSDGYFTRLQVSSLPNINKLNDLENNNFAYKLDSILELENNKTSLAFWQNQANDSQTLACATKKGKVMRIKSFSAPKSDSFIGFNLDDDDVVCQAKICYESDKLVFITANAQLLVFPASKVRPQGKGSGGMAGIKLSDDNLIAFSSVKNKNEAHILTAAGQSSALPGLENGFVKVSPLEIYPEKGRSTGGVRCQRFLKGQDKLIFAEISEFRPRAWTSKGQKISLPEISDKRDGAGQKIDYPIAYAN